MNQDTMLPQRTEDAAELNEDSGRKSSSGPSEEPEKQDLFQGPLRRGHWTDAEMSYVEALIEAFQGGNLDDVKGECSTLRGYLAEKVHCSPKRISKKFESSGYYGRQTYRLAKASASIPTEAEISKQEERQSRLQILKEKFVESVGDYALEVQTKKKKHKPKKVRKKTSFQGNVLSVGVASPAAQTAGGGTIQMASNDLGPQAAANHHMLGQLNPQPRTVMNSASLGRLHSSFGGISAESLGLAPSSIHGLQLERLLQSLGPSSVVPPHANLLSLTTGYTPPVEALLLGTLTNQMRVNQVRLHQLQAGTQMHPSAAGSNLHAVVADPMMAHENLRQIIQNTSISTVSADPTGMYVQGNNNNVRTERNRSIADYIAHHSSTAKRTKYN